MKLDATLLLRRPYCSLLQPPLTSHLYIWISAPVPVPDPVDSSDTSWDSHSKPDASRGLSRASLDPAEYSRARLRLTDPMLPTIVTTSTLASSLTYQKAMHRLLKRLTALGAHHSSPEDPTEKDGDGDKGGRTQGTQGIRYDLQIVYLKLDMHCSYSQPYLYKISHPQPQSCSQNFSHRLRTSILSPTLSFSPHTFVPNPYAPLLTAKPSPYLFPCSFERSRVPGHAVTLLALPTPPSPRCPPRLCLVRTPIFASNTSTSAPPPPSPSPLAPRRFLLLVSPDTSYPRSTPHTPEHSIGVRKY
jgi:hypothetical protein